MAVEIRRGDESHRAFFHVWGEDKKNQENHGHSRDSGIIVSGAEQKCRFAFAGMMSCWVYAHDGWYDVLFG
jgi:hypothetical protein